MGTPKSAHHTSEAADTPDTNVPSVFDDSDSPLSSAQSLSSEYLEEYDSPIKTAQAPQPTIDTANESQNDTTWTSPNLYGTAASQRTQRTRKKRILFPGLSQPPEEVFNEEQDTSETSDPAPTAASEDSEESPAPEQNEVQPQQQATKRKRQASKSDVTSEPPKKNVKGAAASKRGGRSKAGHENTEEDVAPAAAAAARPSRKRESASHAAADATTPPAKKAKTTTLQRAIPTKSKSKARTLVRSYHSHPKETWKAHWGKIRRSRSTARSHTQAQDV
jgi:hypothetical protein